jgi:hypothetical protein
MVEMLMMVWRVTREVSGRGVTPCVMTASATISACVKPRHLPLRPHHDHV